ncbi:MAG: histidine phosphatase family protein [Mycobacterium sp.]
MLVSVGGIAVTPITAPLPDVHVPDFALTAGDAQDVVIDFVRHAQMTPPFDDLLTPSPDHPGTPLSDLGQQQAQEVGDKLFNEFGPVAGIFAGQGLRVTETAAPFADLEGTGGTAADVQILPGLNEVDSGIYALDPIDSLGGRLAFLTVAGWSLGSPLGLSLVSAPGSEDTNGIVLDDRFTDAIQTMYNQAMDNPVISGNGQLTDVAFSSTASIFAWVMMNVKNPDLSFFSNLIAESRSVPNGQSTILLPNTAVVQVEGNPTGGWTLVSWDGQAIPADPGLPTDLFVDVRDVMLPAQAALWHIWEAVLGGDSTTINNAVQSGFDQVGSALTQFPGSVFNDIANAIGNLGTDTGGQAAAESGAALGDVLAGGV